MSSKHSGKQSKVTPSVRPSDRYGGAREPCLTKDCTDADLLRAVALSWHIDPVSKPVFRRLSDDDGDEFVFAFIRSTVNVSQIISLFSLSARFSFGGLQAAEVHLSVQYNRNVVKHHDSLCNSVVYSNAKERFQMAVL
jgi:hypothetical protein